ncbi:hypothetical protein ACQY1Q_01510 [Tenacibaculum sp. TC6]|uniref:hypothetical protein n=1 Tax=Tenacibaculum sp. TC6 TaxID=3423223 RepID=UPI003D36DE91
MGAIDWDQIANEAAKQTDAEFNSQLASLTSLNLSDVDAFIKQSNITNANAIKVLKIIDDATISNNSKALAINSVKNGINFLVQLATKVI